jgi:hypothetical protein
MFFFYSLVACFVKQQACETTKWSLTGKAFVTSIVTNRDEALLRKGKGK